MTTLRIAILAAAAASSCFAQLTAEQKAADFRYLAGLYAKQYAPYEWKRTLYGFDALDIAPWLQRVARTTDDLEFYELCVEYISKFNDSHVAYILPSNFVASLGFTVDIFDGRVLIWSDLSRVMYRRVVVKSKEFPSNRAGDRTRGNCDG